MVRDGSTWITEATILGCWWQWVELSPFSCHTNGWRAVTTMPVPFHLGLVRYMVCQCHCLRTGPDEVCLHRMCQALDGWIHDQGKMPCRPSPACFCLHDCIAPVKRQQWWLAHTAWLCAYTLEGFVHIDCHAWALHLGSRISDVLVASGVCAWYGWIVVVCPP